MSRPPSSSNSTDSADLNDTLKRKTIRGTATYVENSESVSGDKSIDMWEPDPSGFLAELGLGPDGRPLNVGAGRPLNVGNVGPAAPTPEATPTPKATPKQKLKQAAMWYYTSAASCFNDQGKMFEDNFNGFKKYANNVFVNQFGLTQNDANNLFSWSGESAPDVSEPKQDTVESKVEEDPTTKKVEEDPTTKKIDVDPDVMTEIKQEVRAELMSIPGVVTRKTETFHTEDTNLMPRVVDARMMETFMKPSGLRGAVIGARWGGGKPGSLEGNKFTVAPGRGRANEFFGTMSSNKGKGTGKTLVQAAVAMGLFNKTGSKVKFTLTGNAKELQNKFSAILDEMERYDLPLDKCQFNLPGKKSCNNIEELKKALLDPNHPLSKATHRGISLDLNTDPTSTSPINAVFSSGNQEGRNRLLMRIQSMENKIKNRSSGAEAPNVNMAHCTQAAILTRAIPEGMTARQQETFAQDLKNMNPETQKKVITDSANNLAIGGSEEQKNQRLDELLGVVATAKSDPNTARNLTGTTIGGSSAALSTLATKPYSYRDLPSPAEAIMTVSDGSPLAQRFAENAVNLQQRACIDNLDPSKTSFGTGKLKSEISSGLQSFFQGKAKSFDTSIGFEKRYDVNDMLTSQQAAADYLKRIDITIETQVATIKKLEEQKESMRIDEAALTKLPKQIDTAYAKLTSLYKDKATAIQRINTACNPMTHIKQRRGVQGADLAKLIEQTSEENKTLLLGMPTELPKLRRQMAAIEQQISQENKAWIYDTPKVTALKEEKASLQQEINRYTDAPQNAKRLALIDIALTSDSDAAQQAQRALEELDQVGKANFRPGDHTQIQETAATFNHPAKVKVNSSTEDKITITIVPSYNKDDLYKNGKPNPDRLFDKDGVPTPETVNDLPEGKRPITVTIPRKALTSKNDFIKSLDETVQEAQKTATQSVLTNSTAVFEAVQAMVPDGDERFSAEATGAIAIFTEDELKKMDVIKEITDPNNPTQRVVDDEKVQKLDNLVNNISKSDQRAAQVAQSDRLIDKVIPPDHNFKVKPLGIKAASETTKNAGYIVEAFNNCERQKETLMRRIIASTKGKIVAGPPTNTNNPKPTPTATAT